MGRGGIKAQKDSQKLPKTPKPLISDEKFVVIEFATKNKQRIIHEYIRRKVFNYYILIK